MGKFRVLVVGEHELLTQLIGRALRPLGCSCDCVENGGKAVEAARTAKYDCLIIETCARHTESFDFLRKVQGSSLNAATPVLVVSCHDETPEELMREYRVQGFVSKPFSAQALVERVGALLDPSVRG